MKITLPRVVRERVGTAYTYPGVDRIYFADDRPNVYNVSEGKAQPIYEPRLQYQTVLDYDFQFEARARGALGAAAGLLLGTAALAVIPVAFVYYVVRDLVSSIRVVAADAANAAGYVVSETRDIVREGLRRVTNP